MKHFNQKPQLGRRPNFCHPLAKGLVGCWLMNEGSGTVVQDLSGKGNMGTITNTLWVPGKFGPCLNFDGSGDYVSASRLGAIAPASDYSVCFWTKFNTVGGSSRFVIDQVRNSGDRFAVFTNDSGTSPKIIFEHYNGSSYNPVRGRTILTTGSWYYFCLVNNGADQAQKKIYLNGIDNTEATTTDLSPGSDASSFHIGSLIFNGLIDNVGIYSRALSASEIAWLYREPFAMFDYPSWRIYV
jgi:hypothetical protein